MIKIIPSTDWYWGFFLTCCVMQLPAQTSQSVNRYSKTRLAVCSLILMNHATTCSLVKLLSGYCESGLRCSLITSGDGFTSSTNSGLQSRLYCYVTLVCFLVGENTLFLRLNVCHCYSKRRLLYKDIQRVSIACFLDNVITYCGASFRAGVWLADFWSGCVR